MKKKKSITIHSDVLSLAPLVTPEGRGGNITLDLNEGYGSLSKTTIKKITSVISRSNLSRYPEYAGLTKSLATGLKVATKNIFLTNGSDDAIKMLIDLFFKKGDRVALPVPTFFIYNHFLKLKGARVEEVPYLKNNKEFQFPTDDLLASIRKGVAGVILCNPGNPIGVSVSKKTLLKIAEESRKRNIPLIVDEAYIEYSGLTLAPFLRQYPHIVLLRTFSKAYGLAGLRIGYVVAGENITSALARLRLPWSVNNIAVIAAQIVLGDKKSVFLEVKNQKARLGNLALLLKKKGAIIYPTTTNFILCKVENAQRTLASLAKKKILVKDLSHYPSSHGLLKNILRITVPSQEDFNKACTAISQAL